MGQAERMLREKWPRIRGSREVERGAYRLCRAFFFVGNECEM
mgnify:CR=1 FL=1